LGARLAGIGAGGSEDICYATTNRQSAVKELAGRVDAVVVVGSRESSNSNRLVETAHAAGVPAWLVEDTDGLDVHHLERFATIGVTAGASTPERPPGEGCARVRPPRGPGRTVLEAPSPETVVFRLPRELRPLDRSPRSDDVAAALVST